MSSEHRNETCPLCGAVFDAGASGCRPSCPMSGGCSVVCCPSCGYGFPQEVGIAGGLRRLLDRFKKARPVNPGRRGKGDQPQTGDLEERRSAQ